MTWSAGLLFVAGFLWKMGSIKAIPNFAGFVLNMIPGPSDIARDTPKPDMDTTLQHIMETPITPFAFVTGMGVLSIGLITLRLTAWALRILPK